MASHYKEGPEGSKRIQKLSCRPPRSGVAKGVQVVDEQLCGLGCEGMQSVVEKEEGLSGTECARSADEKLEEQLQ